MCNLLSRIRFFRGWASLLTGEIKRHPEVETLLVATDNGNEAVKEILDWLKERIDSGPRSLPLNTTPYSQID
jgi:hypothetical protein